MNIICFVDLLNFKYNIFIYNIMSHKNTLELQILGGIYLRQDRLNIIYSFLNNPYSPLLSPNLWYNAICALMSFKSDCQYVIDPPNSISKVIATMPDGTVWFSSLSDKNTYDNFILKNIDENQIKNPSFQESITSDSGYGYQSNPSSYIYNNQNTYEEIVVSKMTNLGFILLSALYLIPQTITEKIFYNTIIMLELSAGYTDDFYKKESFEYIWSKYSYKYPSIQIIDTSKDIYTGDIIINNNKIIDNNIAYLNKYYSNGYRIFLGFSRSTILSGVLSWFNSHSQAIGISLSSSSDALSIPKPIYRLQSPDSKILTSLKSQLDSAPTIYYIYSANENASQILLINLNTLYPTKIKSLSVLNDSTNLTLENIKSLYNNVNTNDITIQYLFVANQGETFINLFSSLYPMPTQTYDISISGIPPIYISSRDGLINKYKYVSYISLTTSILYRDGYNTLGNNFTFDVPNSLEMINVINQYSNNKLSSISAHNSIIEFDENNDVKYYSINVITYTDGYYFKKYSYNIYDPIAGYFDVFF
jgi:hypothetical protein